MSEDKLINNNFMVTLTGLRKGDVVGELCEALQEIIFMVKATGKQGKLKLNLTIKPVPNSAGAQVEILDDVIADVPEHGKPSSFFFTDDDGCLSRLDPRQLDWLEQQKERLREEETAVSAENNQPAPEAKTNRFNSAKKRAARVRA